MLDASREDAKRMMSKVSGADRVKLDEYFSSLRESEKSLQRSERWLSQEHVDVPFPENVPFKTDGLTEYLQKILKCAYFNERSTYLDLLFLAFKFDITRVANCMVNGIGLVIIRIRTRSKAKQDLLRTLKLTRPT